MHRLFRPLIILVLVLLVPIVPFLWFAGPIDAWAARWCTHPPSPPVTAAMIVGLHGKTTGCPPPRAYRWPCLCCWQPL
jgi:hypothetical protein